MEEKGFVNEVLEWLYSIVIALAVAMLIHIFLFQPTRVSGESMENTLHHGDYLVVAKWNHVLRKAPQYGDIVIIDSRVKRERTWKDDAAEPMMNYVAFFNKDMQSHNVWVKRVIGKAGDTLEFKEGSVWRNGEKLDEPYIKEKMLYAREGVIKIPEGQVFVMGDNRNHSSDSRFIGPVPVGHVLGTVLFDF